MPPIRWTGTSRDLPKVLRMIRKHNPAEILRSQANRRIEAGGDSQHKYPELWATRKGLGYRAGGQPLLDTARGAGSLHGRTLSAPSGFIMRLMTGVIYMVYHQFGFKTKGPNWIPLTMKAKKRRVKWSRAIKQRSAARRKQKNANTTQWLTAQRDEQLAQQALDKIGLVEGEDYIMAWQGVTVPPRKIFNTPPEHVREIAREIGQLATRVTKGNR